MRALILAALFSAAALPSPALLAAEQPREKRA